MSRDLSFWRTNGKIEINNKTIYTALSNAEHLACIDEIPFDEIQADFNVMFKDWANENNLNYEKGSESFQLMITKQFARVDCHKMTEMNMNMIIDIMLKYNCPLYDSAIDVRFNVME